MEDEYEVKAKTTSIRYTSRLSIKIHESFYTVEACEERIIPDVEGVDIEKEREALWDTVNSECDKQAEEIRNMFKKVKNT